jgi:uncharacterized surface protein with fasciclin (FAS1) repeats
MKNISKTATFDIRPTAFTGLAMLILLLAFTTAAEAKHCGMMKKPTAAWGPPMYKAMPYAGQQHRWGPGQQKTSRRGSNVISVAQRLGQFGTLLTAIEAANMTALLEGKGPYTLFAPTDDAFKKLPEGALQELLADKEKLIALLKLHVVPGNVTAAKILQSSELQTASGQKLSTTNLGVIRADIPARNGTIHIIDKVLLPTI